MYVPGSTTTLAQNLKNGDTIVYFTDVSGFKNNYNGNYSRHLIFWNYKNSYGYQYEPETYSRNEWTNLWSDDSVIDRTNNTITLSSPWSHGTFVAGTPVSQGNYGATNIYLNSNYLLEANKWTLKTGQISGIGKNNAGNKFREGTAFIKINWYLDYNSIANATTKLSTITFTKNTGLDAVNNLQNYMNQNIENLQHQIDGAIQFWNGPDIPTLNKRPFVYVGGFGKFLNFELSLLKILMNSEFF